MTKREIIKSSSDIESRLAKMSALLERTLPARPAAGRSTPDDQYRHLLEEAQQLYENELAWEEETGEESMEEGAVVSLVFPGTLALVDALVTSHTVGEHGEGSPHKDVVAAFASWLSERLLKLRSGEIRGSATDRAKEVDLTDRLIDLVLHRYCELSADEVEQVEASSN